MESQFYGHIIDSISEALITINQDRKILVWNRAAKFMFGYDKVEVENASLDLIIPPNYRERHKAGYETFFTNMSEHSTYISETKEFEGLRKNGEIFPVQLTHSLFKISNQEFYITATIRDATIIKHYELMKERLEHTARHDLKNKLIVISLAANRLNKILTRHQVPKCSEYMRIIQSESEEVLALIESSRDLMLLESGRYPRQDVSVDMVKIVLTIQERMQSLALSRDITIKFENHTPRRSINVMADPALVKRSLENLVKNAIEAENPSGEIRLILLQNEAGVAFLEIHNGGNPIPEAIQKVLFQPYVTHGKKSGSGLGLYIAKLIIEKVHGWQLTFASESGKDTVFRITFNPSPADNFEEKA